MLAAGFCLGLAVKRLALNKTERKLLKERERLRASCFELWPEWFK